MTTESKEQPEYMAQEIIQAMLRVQKRIHEIPKTGRNDFHKYNYRTIDDVLVAVRTVCSEEGITIHPTSQDVREYQLCDDGKTARIVIEAVYSFTSAVDGSCVFVKAVGEGTDKGDKAAYKAMTGAQKYALTQAFSIPCDGLDPEADDRGPKGR